MNRTRATFFLLVAAIASFGATGCHRHRRMAYGAYPTTAYAPYAAPAARGPAPYVIIVETRGQAAPDVTYAQEAAEQDAAAAREAAHQARIEREQAKRARIAQARAERVRIARERAAQAQREQAERDAQARAAAQGKTTIIVLRPGAQPVVVDGQANGQAGVWFEGQ
jgi:dipeptidase